MDSQPFEPSINIINDSGSEDIHYFSLYEELPEEFQQYARAHLHETDENKERGLRELKAFIQEENLSSVDDLLLMAILRSCKYDIKKSKPKLKRFLKQRQIAIDDLARADMMKFRAVLDDFVYCFLPYRDKHGRIIIFSRPNLHFENYTMTEVTLVCKITMLFLLRYPLTTITGVAYIGESRCPIKMYYRVMKYFNDILSFAVDCPFRIGRIDGVHAHFILRLMVTAAQRLLSEKVKGRVFLHRGGCKELDDVYHPSLRPEEVGGTAGPLTDSFYREKLMAFIEELKLKGATTNLLSSNTN